jgi:hypothetical protein
MDRMRRELEQEQRRKLTAGRDELKRDLTRRDRVIRQQYDALLREYQNNVREDVARAKLEMDVKYRDLAAVVQRAEREWKERADSLAEEARQYRADVVSRERLSNQESAKSIEEAAEVYSRVDATPHRFFFPNRISAFFEALKDAVDLRKMGLHEAAAAISLSTRSGLERFGYDVRDKHDEWVRCFSRLKARVGSLHLRLEAELAEWTWRVVCAKNTPPDEKHRRVTEIDYWSKGVYLEARRGVDELGRIIARVMKAGAAEYLKDVSALGADELKQCAERADAIGGALDKLGELYKTRYDCSCQRMRWGETIIDFLEKEIDFLWLPSESGWREADGDTAETFRTYMSLTYPDGDALQDTREWLGLAFENMAGSKIFVYIVPEERAWEVRNKLLVYVDHVGNDPQFAREIYGHVLESLNLTEEDGSAALVFEASQMTMNPNPSCRSAGLSLEKHLRQHG